MPDTVLYSMNNSNSGRLADNASEHRNGQDDFK